MSQRGRKSASNFDEAEHLPTNIVILLIILTILLIGGGLGLAYFVYVGQMNAQVQATAVAQTSTVLAITTATAKTDLTATAAQTATAQANATAASQANATATTIAATTQANANATATATVVTANPDLYPPGGGTLILYDPLRDNNQGNKWATNTTNCLFTGGAYHAGPSDTSHVVPCAATSTNFSNFAYEVQMQIIKGDAGGIIFRADSTNKNFYLFSITQTGNYELLLCSGITCHTIMASTASPAIHRGLNQTNIVGVVAIGNSITLFVNHQQVASVTDKTYGHGQIGVIANPLAINGHPTEVVYSNAKVWML